VIACPGAAQARVLLSSTAGLVTGPALAPGGRVVVGERGPGATVRVLALDPRGRRSRRVLGGFSTAGAPRGGFASVLLTGTGGVIGVTIDANSDDPKSGPAVQASRGLTLLPSARLGSCAPPSALGLGSRVDVAGGRGFAATLENCRTLAADVRVHDAAGERTIPAAPGTQTSMLRAAGRYVAWREYGSAGGAVVLARAATGRVLRRIAVPSFGPEDLAVGADGSLVWIATSGRRGCSALYAVSADRPAPRALTGVASPCAFGSDGFSGQSTLAIAGGRVVYPSSPRWVLADGAGGAKPIAGIAIGMPAGLIAFDGRTLYAVRAGCDADRLLALDVDAPGALPTGPAYPPDNSTCPVTRTGPDRLRVSTLRRVRIRLHCPNGCHGELRLVQQRRYRERIAGRLRTGGRGTLTVHVPLARYAAALASCPSGLRVAARFHRFTATSARAGSPFGQELGVLRLRAAGPCRPGRGPRFIPRVLRLPY
jgi:hypothetical protein